MNKFWIWMIEQGYAIIYDNGSKDHQYRYSLKDTEGTNCKPEYIMLIGYLEEYLIVKHGIGIGNNSKIYEELHKSKKYADIRYEQLVKEIIKLDDKNYMDELYEQEKMLNGEIN